jgi:competence protein ComEA
VFLTPTQRPDRDVLARQRLEQLKVAAPVDHPDDPVRDPEWDDDTNPKPQAAAPWWRRGRPGRLVERWVPGGVAATPRRLPVVLVIGIALSAAIVMVVVLAAGGGHEVAPALPAASAAPQTQPTTTGSIVVSVVGQVARPGLVSLPDGARVADALQAAGGALPGIDLSGLNIARRLGDGEQVNVGVPPPVDNPPGADPSGKIDLNSASVTQLDTLPGVGSVTAQRLVDWRTKHGRFTSVEQLREVDGIGPARFAQLKDLVVVR